MWLRTPETVEDVLWEGRLEPETEEVVQRTLQELESQGKQTDLRKEIRDLPIVSVGRPDVWSLLEVYPLEKMPDLLQAKLEEADFYLVRTACSFRPKQQTSSLSWARFAVRLLPGPTEQQPVAYDLYPKEVYQETKRQVKVSLSPTLNFQELQAGAGGAEFGLEYPELQPIISAAGIGETTPSWDYEKVRGIELQGSKIMHLLVEAPKETTSSWASLKLVADVVVQGLFLPAILRPTQQEAADPLTVQLW